MPALKQLRKLPGWVWRRTLRQIKSIWPRIRRFYTTKLRRKSINFIYVPTNAGLDHSYKIHKLNGLTQQDLGHTLWIPPIVGATGKWIVDNKNIVEAQITIRKLEVDKHIKEFDNLYPFKPRSKPETIRETAKRSIEELKKGTSNG